MKWIAIIYFALLTGCANQSANPAKDQSHRGPQYPSASRPFPEEKIAYEQWQYFFDKKRTNQNAEVRETESVVIITLPTATYLFTKLSHPAYPAVDIMIYSADRTEMIRTGHYAGSEEKFYDWWRHHKH